MIICVAYMDQLLFYCIQLGFICSSCRNNRSLNSSFTLRILQLLLVKGVYIAPRIGELGL